MTYYPFLRGAGLTATLLCTSLLSPALVTSAYAQSAAYDDPIDEVIVTGSPLTRSVDEAITGVSVLSGDELADRLAGTIGETLKSEPGVSSTSFGAGASRPIIRGQGGDRVRVLLNGIGSIDASSASPDHAVAAEPAQAERIEVLRGASVLRYGSSGAGGIVNVIDGRIPTEVPDELSGAFRLGASSVDRGHESAGALDVPLGQNLVLHIDGTYRVGHDYNIPDFAESATLRALEEAEEEHHEDEDEEDHDEDDEHGHEEEEEARNRLPNSFVETKSGTVGLSYVGERGFIGAALHRFESVYGVPGGHGHGEEEHHDEEEEDHDDDDHEDEEEHGHEEEEEGDVTIGLEQTRFDVNGALNLDGAISRLQIFAGYADYTHTEFEGPGVVGTVFTNEGYEIRGEAIQAERNGWSAAYGAQIRRRDFSAIGEEAFVAPTRTDQYGVYTFQEKEIGDFHLEGAARFEQTDQELSDGSGSVDFQTVSLSAGGDYHLSDAFRLGGTVFRTQRAPTTEELFSNGPHLATEQFERGDASLDVETATGVELALRHRSDDGFFTVNLFYTDYENYIFERALDEEEDGLTVYQYSAENAQFSGFEVQGGYDFAQAGDYTLRADGLVEFVRAQTDSANLPRIPPLSVLAGLEAQSDRLKLRGEVDWVSESSDLAPFEIPTESYALINAFATWKPLAGDQDVRFKLSLHNLLDEDARQHSSFLKDVAPLPGRNVRFAIATSF